MGWIVVERTAGTGTEGGASGTQAGADAGRARCCAGGAARAAVGEIAAEIAAGGAAQAEAVGAERFAATAGAGFGSGAGSAQAPQLLGSLWRFVQALEQVLAASHLGSIGVWPSAGEHPLITVAKNGTARHTLRIITSLVLAAHGSD